MLFNIARSSTVVTALALLLPARALHFYMENNAQKCFLEELASDVIVEGHYQALEWFEERKSWDINSDLTVQVTVTDVSTGEIVTDVKGRPDGKFTFTSHEAGDHSICLRPQSNESSGFFTKKQIKFYLDIAIGSAKKDTSQDTNHINTLATKIRELNEKVESIRMEQQYQREVEAVFRDASEATNSRAVYWVLFQMVVLLGMGVWQAKHLKTYFADKKLR